MKKFSSLIETTILMLLLYNIVIRWNIAKVTVGDFFCLEVLAMLFWYKYDTFKNK